MERYVDQISSLLKRSRKEGQSYYRSSPSFYNPHGSRRSFLRNPKMPPLFISTREKGTGNYATITKGFYC